MPPLPHPSGTTKQGDYIYLGAQMREYGQACADAERARLESVEADLLEALKRTAIEALVADLEKEQALTAHHRIVQLELMAELAAIKGETP